MVLVSEVKFSRTFSCVVLQAADYCRRAPSGDQQPKRPRLGHSMGKKCEDHRVKNKWPVVLMHVDHKAVTHHAVFELGSAIFLQVDLVTHTVLAVLSELQRYHSRIGFCSECVRCVLKPFDEEVMTSLKRRCCLLSRRPHWAAFCGPAESTGQRNFLKMT